MRPDHIDAQKELNKKKMEEAYLVLTPLLNKKIKLKEWEDHHFFIPLRFIRDGFDYPYYLEYQDWFHAIHKIPLTIFDWKDFQEVER